MSNINKQIMTCNWREVPLNYFNGLCQKKIFMNQNREKAFEISKTTLIIIRFTFCRNAFEWKGVRE